ncbi:hypothetical protein, partial [Mesorhizobium sp. 128a]
MLLDWAALDHYQSSDEAVDGETQAREHLSGQAFGEQEHVSRPAVPMEAGAGPGDSAPGFAAADWGATPDDEQDPGGLLYPSAEPDWLQEQQLFRKQNAPEPVAGPSDSAPGVPTEGRASAGAPLQGEPSVPGLTGLTPPLPDPTDMDSTIGLTVDGYFPASDVDGETYPQAHEHLSGQASGEQGHDWPPAAPLEANAGPGDSPAGSCAADGGAPEDYRQAIDIIV